MDKKSTVIIWSYLMLATASLGVTYYRYVIEERYTVFQSEEEMPTVADYNNSLIESVIK